MTPFTHLFLFLSVAGGVHACATPSHGVPAYHGTVVDTESKTALEGAVVVVIWHRKPIVSMDGPQYFHRAVEVLTDSQGRFSVDASPGIDWNPLTYVRQDPRVVIFKPGYGPFPWAHVSTKSVGEMKGALLKEGAVVELPRLKTLEQRRKFATLGGLSIFETVPREAIPNVIRLVNIQRKSVGLPPYPEIPERGSKP